MAPQSPIQTRTIGANLDGQGFTGVEAICGDAFFDALIKNPEVRVTFLKDQAAADLRSAYVSGGQTWGSFEFGGILWTNYRGNAVASRWSKPTWPTSTRPACRTCLPPCGRQPTISRRSTPWASRVTSSNTPCPMTRACTWIHR